MSIFTKILRQDCVVWGLDENGPVDDFAQPILSAPVQTKVRWMEEQTEYVGADGTKQMSVAVVYIGLSLNPGPGSVLMLGTLADVVADKKPLDHPGAMATKGRKVIKNIRQSKGVRKLFL